MLTTYPLINFSFRSRVLELIEDMGMSHSNQLGAVFRRFVLTVVTLGFTYALAVRLPNIWGIMRFVGSTGSVFISFIMPAALALKLDPGRWRTRIMATILFVLGGVLIAGGVGNIMMMF